MKFSAVWLATILSGLAALPDAHAGPLAYALCQSGEHHLGLTALSGSPDTHIGCNGLAVACYAGAGFTFGTVTAGAAVPAVIVGCNIALGTCMAGCATVALFAPTP